MRKSVDADDSQRAHVARRVAWLGVPVYAVAAVAAVALNLQTGGNSGEIALLLSMAAYAVIGALVVGRQTRNPIGWLILTSPLAAAISTLVQEYQTYSVITLGRPLPLVELAGWIATWTWMLMLAPLVFVVLLFPSGHLPSPRWRPLAWATWIFFGIALVIFAVATPDSGDPYHIPNTYHIVALEPLYTLLNNSFYLYIATFALAAAALISRYRASRSRERQQLKWILVAAIVMVVSFLVSNLLPQPFADFAWVTALIALPVAIGLAILQYRLYDIDVLINRTIVYAGVTLILGATFVAAVVLLQTVLSPFTRGNEIGAAVSTLVTFALFQPLRRTVQAFVDRRFNRRKYDAERTLEDFARRLRDEVELDAVKLDLVDAVSRTVGPSHVSVWLARSVGAIAPESSS